MDSNKSEEIFGSFNNRIRNSLNRRGIYTVDELLTKTEIDLLHFTNMGVHSVEQIVKTLKKHGLQLHYIPNQFSAVYVNRKKVNRVRRAMKVLLTGK